MANNEPKKGPGMKPITNITQLSGLGSAAVAETSSKPDYKAAIRALQNSEKTDHSTWRVVGQGVFGANGEDSTSLMASMLSQGDRDKTYDMLSGLNPTDPGAAAARQAYMQHVDYEREQEEAERLRKEQEALARARQTASGGNAQTAGTVSSANTSTYDAEIARLKKMLAQESRLGRQDQIDFLNSELARVQQERAQAAANRAGNPDDFIASIPERTKAAARQQNRSRSPEALQETPSLADLQEQLYAAQGANDQSEIDRLQREIARVGETQQSVELRAEVDAFRSNPYSGMDDATLGQTIDEIRSRISLAQSMQQRALADTSRQMTPDERYASAQPWRDEEARQNANLQAALSAYQMGEEQRSRMQVLSDAQGELDRAKDAVSRAGNVYNQAVSEYNASVSAMREADENVRIANAEGQYYADMYKARANQLNALVRQYEARAASGADAEDLTALYEKIRQAEVDVNLLENAVGQKGTAQQLAINAYNQSVGAYNQAIEGVQGASGAVDYVQQRLENRIGTYYDAVAESRSLPTAYKDAYENVLGLTALIDGYEQRIEQARDARDVAEYSSRISELKAERAQYYAYAYEYEMSRTLAGMSEQELSDFRTIAEYLRNPDIYDARSDLSTKAREYERKYKEQYGDINYNRVLDMVSREEDRRHRESYQKMIEGESWLGDVGLSAISVITNMLSVPGALAEIVVQSVDDVDAPINTNARGFLMQNVTRDIRGVIGQKIEQSILDAGGSAQDAHLASMGYSTLLSGLDSAVAVFTGRAGASALGLGAEAAEKIGGALLGATAASTSMQDIVERGGKPEEALIGGLIAGTFECLFEEWSIGNFTALEESVGVGDFYEVLTNLAKSALTNFEEEAATELANIAYDGLSGFLGGQSEWKNRFYELKSANHLTDAQTALALASEIAVQIVEAGASGALMGAGFGAIGSITGNIRNRQNNRALQSVYDEQINSGYERLMEMNSMLLPENRIDLPTLDEHTTFEQLQEVAQQVKDAIVKQNAAVKTVEAENPEAVAAARTRASELSAVNVHTVATAADVSAQAEAGAQAGEADARTAENAVSRETSADTAQTETVAPAEEESDLAEEDALKEITELDESAGGKSYYMDEAADRIAQLREEGRGEVADAMQRILDARENGAAEAPAQAEVTNDAESGIINAEGDRSRTNVFTADEQAEIARLADTVISDAMDAADARVYAQEIANDYRAAARPDIAEAIVAEVESRLAGGNENAALYDNGRERTVSANPGRQSGRVAERAGETAGAAERAESGGQTGAEQGRAGEAGGSDEVTDSAVRDMSELDKNGYPGKTVRDVTDSPEHISLRERAKADGVDLVVVEGTLHFKTKAGKDLPTNGAYDPATNKIYVQADFSGYSAEEIYNHELFHMRKAQNSAMYAEVEKLVRSLYGNDLAAVLNQYRGLYSKLGDISDDYLLEELCADCYAGMDRFERDQSYYADDVREIVDKYEYDGRVADTSGEMRGAANSVNAEQRISSAKTSIKQIPALFTNSRVQFGETNVDIGGGRFDLATNYLREQGTENYIFDPFNRSDAENRRALDVVMNGGADTATCANVLNVIAEEGARANVILEAAKAIKPGGTAYFMVYEGDGSGVGRETSSGWQNNRKTADYVGEIEQYFDTVRRNGKLITATNPKADLPQAYWETSLGNTIRFSASTDDLLNDTASGYESEDGKAPTMEKKAASASAASELDRRAKEAYDKALAEHNEGLADLLHKQWAAQDKSRDLYREANMEMNAYRADGNREHLNRANDLRRQAKLEQQKASRLSKQTNLDLDQHFEPKEAMRQAADRIMQTFKVKPGLKAQYRAEIADMLADIYRRGSINDADVERLVYRLADDSSAYSIPDAAHEQIREIMKSARIYVSPEVRAEFGDRAAYDDFRRYCWGMGINLTSNESDRAIDSYYDELSSTIGEGLFPEETDMAAMLHRMADEMALATPRETSFLSELTKEEGANVDEVYEDLINNVLGTLTAFAEDANLETRLSVKPDTDTMRMKARYEAREDLLRERRDALVKKIKDHAKEVNERGRERRKRSEAIGRIRKELDRIYKRAKVNNQNFERIINEQDAATREHMEDVFSTLNGIATSMTGMEITNPAQLAGWLKQYKDANAGFDPSGALDSAVQTLTQIEDWQHMSVEDLDLLLDVLRGIDYALANADKLVSEGWDEQLSEVGNRMRSETKGLKGVKKYVPNLWAKGRVVLNEESLSYARNLRRYGGWNPNSVMSKFADLSEQADTDAMKYKLGADMVLMPFLNRRNNEARRNWLYTAAGKDAKFAEVTIPALLADGTAAPGDTMKIKVTQMMLVQMYLDLRNEDNLRHIQYGGYTIPDVELYRKGQNRQAYTSGMKHVRMTAETMQRIVNENLAAEGKEFAELLDKYYNSYAKPLINATSRAIDGRDKAVTPNYYPIRNDRNYHTNTYNIYDGTIENMGPLKERVKGARSPIYLADADETFQWHKEMMSKYTGYAKLLRDFRALLNYDAGGDMTNEGVLTDKFGQGAAQFIQNYFKNVETGKIEDAKTMSKILGNYISNVLNANISSMLKQFSALPLAGSTYGMEPILYALGHNRAVDKNLIRKYTAYLDERSDIIAHDQITDIVRKKAGSTRTIVGASVLGKNWLEATDYAANKLMWIAAQHYVDTHTNLRPGSEADIQSGKDLYYKEVAKVFDKMTFDTQTNANTMSKPDILRHVDSGIKAFTLFKTDAFQVQGILREAIGEYRWAKRNGDAEDVRKAGQKLYHSIQGVGVASIVQAMMAAIAKLLRHKEDEFKDEDGNWDAGKIGKRLTKDTFENVAGAVLFGSTLYSWLWSLFDKDEKFYDIESSAVSAVTDLLSAISSNSKKIFDAIANWNAAENKDKSFWAAHTDDLLKPLWNIAKQIAGFTGISVSNMEKNLMGILGLVWPELTIGLSDQWTEYSKTSLVGKTGRELKAAMKAYISDELGVVSDAMLDEYVRLYEVFGEDLKPSLPSANEPTVYDENGKKRDLTPEEFATWDATYRTSMIDLVNGFAESDSYNALTDDQKVSVLKRALAYAKENAKGSIGLKSASYVGKVQAAQENGADIVNALLYYDLQSAAAGIKNSAGSTIQGSKLLNQFKALEEMNISDTQKAAIYHAMYQSTGGKWKEAAATKTDQEFLEYAREQFAEIQSKVDSQVPAANAAEPAPTSAPAPVSESVEAPEPVQEQPKEDPLKPEYDKAMSAGISEDGAQAAVKAVEGLDSDASAYEKRNAAVMALDSVEDQLAACKYYSEKPEADYGRYSAANGFGVTPKTFFTFYNDAVARYGQLSQAEAQAALDARNDLTQEQKAAMWQLCGANWSASKNPYAVYISEQVRDAYYAAG